MTALTLYGVSYTLNPLYLIRQGICKAADRITPEPTETAARTCPNKTRTIYKSTKKPANVIAILLKSFFSAMVSLRFSESTGLSFEMRKKDARSMMKFQWKHCVSGTLQEIEDEIRRKISG